jgi:DNA-binding GntR family transcriptional regulator
MTAAGAGRRSLEPIIRRRSVLLLARSALYTVYHSSRQFSALRRSARKAMPAHRANEAGSSSRPHDSARGRQAARVGPAPAQHSPEQPRAVASNIRSGLRALNVSAPLPSCCQPVTARLAADIWYEQPICRRKRHAAPDMSFDRALTAASMSAIVMRILDTELRIPYPRSVMKTEAMGFKIAAELRNDILLGRLAAGTVLNQGRLCERFETSRMPVRDALHLLHYERLLVHDRGKHLCVAGIQPGEIADIYAVKAVIHGRAARRATERSTPDELERLRTTNNRMQDAALAARHLEIAEANWEFHHVVNSLARAPYLIAALRTMNLRTGADLFSDYWNWTKKCVGEHSGIVDAMVAGDGVRAEELMIDHVHHSAEFIGAWLRTVQAASATADTS